MFGSMEPSFCTLGAHGQLSTTVNISQHEATVRGTMLIFLLGSQYPEKVGSSWTRLLGVFLPSGYPHSVTDDYIKYQIYDSLQAFSSSIAGLLSSRAVLQGVGVGDANASPTTALLLSILQESTGRIATIIFAHRLGTSLEPECKMYRLAADIFNDAAMLLDCLSPALPRGPRVLLLSSSSMLRALCGVAAGSSKASLSAHFAKWGNLGELNAVSQQHTLLIAMVRSRPNVASERLKPGNYNFFNGNAGMPVAGSVVVSYVSSPITTWTCLILLLSIHLAMNRAAVRAVMLHSLNRQRANLVISTYLDRDKVLTPKEVSVQEWIFEWDGVLRWRSSSPLAAARIGSSLQVLLASLGPARKRSQRTGSIRDTEARLTRLIRLYSQEEFLVWYDAPQRLGHIILKEGAAAESQLKAWALYGVAPQDAARAFVTVVKLYESTEEGRLGPGQWQPRDQVRQSHSLKFQE
ncbi:MAG: hypothetical protein Q9205_004092 [Flavoplaca limonia]